MKKLFLLAMIVLGTSLAQAQNTITIGTWTTGGQVYGLLVSEESQACFQDAQMQEKQETVYSWDSSTRTLSFGTVSAIFPGAQGDTYETSFSGSNYLLIPLLSDRSAIDGSVAIPTQPTAISAN